MTLYITPYCNPNVKGYMDIYLIVNYFLFFCLAKSGSLFICVSKGYQFCRNSFDTLLGQEDSPILFYYMNMCAVQEDSFHSISGHQWPYRPYHI